MNGYLELIIGPMFSGKTSKLIELYNLQKYHNSNLCSIAVINYQQDTRYSKTKLSSHDRLEVPCIFCENLYDVLESDEISSSKLILINEGQFFPDLYEATIELVEKQNKHVYIAGLDGDFRRQPFGDILKLVPISDKVTKLRSQCMNLIGIEKTACKENAIFSYRINENKDQIHIGSSDSYMPLCRNCYLLKTTT